MSSIGGPLSPICLRALFGRIPRAPPGRCPSSTGRVSLLWRGGGHSRGVPAPPGGPPSRLEASARRKRWLAHNFRVRGSSCVHGEWRHCATSGRGAPGMGGERYAAATFLGPHRGTRPFSPAWAAPDHIPCASRTSWVPCSTRPGGAARERMREMALWEDRSAPHSTALPPEPRNHAEISGRIRGADPNDPPGAPESGSGGDAASPGRGSAAVAVRLSLRPRPPGADRAWIRVSRSCGEDWDCAPVL